MVSKGSQPRTLSEIDVLQASTSQSANNAPREPVYTNPFAEQDKPRKSAGYHGETPLFGPKLAQKTSRVLTGEDKIKFEQDMISGCRYIQDSIFDCSSCYNCMFHNDMYDSNNLLLFHIPELHQNMEFWRSYPPSSNEKLRLQSELGRKASSQIIVLVMSVSLNTSSKL